jgi:DNA-binding NarL/FixJ family response regulator
VRGSNEYRPFDSSPKEIAQFVAAGLSNKQIARKASILEGTVKIHLHCTYRKLGIANRSMLAAMVSSGARAPDP